MADGVDPGDLRPEPPASASEEPTAPGNLQRGSNVSPAKTSKTSKTSCRFAIEPIVRRWDLDRMTSTAPYTICTLVGGEDRLGSGHWPSSGLVATDHSPLSELNTYSGHRICYFVAFMILVFHK